MRPSKIRCSNFKGFGESVEINFDQYKDEESILVLGLNFDSSGADSNMSGKTSIFDAISWAIFNRVPDSRVALDDLIRRGTKQCSVELVLKDEENSLKIIRKRGKETKLRFWVNDNEHTKLTDTQTQRSLMNFLGIQEDNKEFFNDFLNTVYFSIDAIEAFAGKAATSEDRMALISRFLNLDILDKCSNRANGYKNNIKSNLDNTRGQIEYLEQKLKSEDSEREISFQEEYEIKIANLNELRTEIHELESKYEKINEKLQLIESIKEIDILDEKADFNLKEFIEFTQSHIEVFTKRIENIKASEKTIKKCKETLYSLPSLSEILEQTKTLEKDMQTLGNRKFDIKEQINYLERDLSDIEGMLKGDKNWKCPNCKIQLMWNRNKGILDTLNKEELISKKHELELKIKNENKKLRNIDNQIFTIENNIRTLSNDETNIRTIQERLETVQESMSDKESLSDKIKEAQDKIKEKEISTIKTKKEYKEKKFQLTLRLKGLERLSVEGFEDLQEKIKEKKLKVDQLKLHLSRLKVLISQRRKELSRLEEMRKELEGIQKEFDVFYFWEKHFKTIRRWMIEDFLPAFEKQVNLYLDLFEVGIKIQLDTLTRKKRPKTSEDEYKPKFNLSVIDEMGVKAPLETFSAGGQKRIAVCIGFALRQLTLNRGYSMFRFLMLDEIADNLDAIGVELFFKILKEISGLKLIVSHNNELASKFKNKIIVKRENGVSFV